MQVYKGMPLLAAALAAGAVTAGGAGVVVGVGALVALVAVLAAVRLRPVPGSRWRRGWWLMALSAVPLGVSATPPIVAGDWGPGVGAVAAVILLIGLVRARPVRDAAQGRELLVEAILAGLLMAYVTGAVVIEGDLTAQITGQLVALCAEVATLTVAIQHLLRDREAATRPDRLVSTAVALLVATRAAGLLGAIGLTGVLEPGGVLLTIGTAAALSVLGVALASPLMAERLPVPGATDAVLAAGHVTVVVAVVLAGPVAVTMHGILRGPDNLLAITAGGALLALLGVLHLVQLVRDHGRRAWRARHDALTGLPTEPLFHDRIDQAIARARRTGRGLAVAFVDLDGFKRVNDQDGHEAGDAVLRAVARRLRAALREQDTVARKSGDEFLVLLPDVEGPEAAEVVAGKLVVTLHEPVDVGRTVHHVGASVGLALWPRDGADGEELIRHADAAMYDVKEDHGGAVRWYTRVTTARTRLRLTLAGQLEAAIGDADQLDVAYHPRVDLRDGRVEGLTALVRWRHPNLGLITPRSFLPLAAEAGLSRAIDLAVAERVARDLTRWRVCGWCDVPVAVHLADSHVGHPDLEEEIVAILRRTGLAARQLQLTVTEVGLTRGGRGAATSIRDLAELGVATTVSRFGTGAVSLDTLASVPVTGVELASAHVATLDKIPSRAVDVALAVAERLGLSVTANGVSTPEQAHWLRAAGCPVARGPRLAAPLMAGVLEARLSQLALAGGSSDSITVAALTGDTAGADAERPEVAGVLAAAVGLDQDIEEGALVDVLALLDQGVEAVS